MRAGFKFPADISVSEVEAFRAYQARLRPILEDYRIAVDKLNADYDMALDALGDEYDAQLEQLSEQHDTERRSQMPVTP